MKRKAMTKKSTPGKLSRAQLQYLTSGVCLDVREYEDATGGPFGSVDAARFAWKAHRDELMKLRAAEGSFENYKHGERPHGWWLFEAKQPRLQIAGPPVEPIGLDLYEGIPRLMKEWPKGCEFESQFTYLKRLGLLFPGEEEAVKRIQRPPAGV
jgi:hypothetical protein